jgi:hypothetical protein
MNAVLSTFFKQFNGKFPLNQWLASRNGYAAVRFLVKISIGLYCFHDAAYRLFFPPNLQCVGRTSIGAFEATRARLPVNTSDEISLADKSVFAKLGAFSDTIAAFVDTDAAGGINTDLGIRMYAFRIAAPSALHGASF